MICDDKLDTFNRLLMAYLFSNYIYHVEDEIRKNDFDLVKSQRFRDFLKAQGFVLVTWADLAKANK